VLDLPPYTLWLNVGFLLPHVALSLDHTLEQAALFESQGTDQFWELSLPGCDERKEALSIELRTVKDCDVLIAQHVTPLWLTSKEALERAARLREALQVFVEVRGHDRAKLSLMQLSAPGKWCRDFELRRTRRCTAQMDRAGMEKKRVFVMLRKLRRSATL